MSLTKQTKMHILLFIHSFKTYCVFLKNYFIVNLQTLIVNLEEELEVIIKRLKDSGLMVNNGKTEICLFHRNNQNHVAVTIAGIPVKSLKSMNMLGVTFDSKLNWKEHVTNAIKKSNKSLNAIRLIRKYFNTNELKL
jgi:hypothetical protein